MAPSISSTTARPACAGRASTASMMAARMLAAHRRDRPLTPAPAVVIGGGDMGRLLSHRPRILCGQAVTACNHRFRAGDSRVGSHRRLLDAAGAACASPGAQSAIAPQPYGPDWPNIKNNLEKSALRHVLQCGTNRAPPRYSRRAPGMSLPLRSWHADQDGGVREMNARMIRLLL